MRAAERARREALLARATAEGVPGIGDELAILCSGCGRRMLIVGRPRAAVRCLPCGPAPRAVGDGETNRTKS